VVKVSEEVVTPEGGRRRRRRRRRRKRRRKKRKTCSSGLVVISCKKLCRARPAIFTNQQAKKQPFQITQYHPHMGPLIFLISTMATVVAKAAPRPNHHHHHHYHHLQLC